MGTERQNLREKLSRELAQAEYDAIRHTEREASRLGMVLPAERMRAIAEHAKRLRPRFDKLVGKAQPLGTLIARAIGEAFSDTRHYVVDRILSTERSYRATLLGLRHGLDAARLLRDVARVDGDATLADFCDDLIRQRETLLSAAQDALAWFAEHADVAMASGATASR